MSDAFLLRAALRANGVFSTCSGLALLGAPDALAAWLGLGASPWLRLVGIGLLGFGLWLLIEAARRRVAPARALAISMLDAAWMVASIVVLVVFGDVLAVQAVATIAAVAVIVTACLVCQLVAIDRIYIASHRESIACVSR